MEFSKRRQFWIDAPLQLQMLGFVLVVVALSLLLVSFSLLRGLDAASLESKQIFHSLEWIRQALRGPLIVSSALCILASGVATLLWSHRFAGPLRVLSAAVTRWGQGDLSAPIRVRASDTHQELVKEFSQMQDQLKAMLLRDRKRVEDISRRLSQSQNLSPEELKAIAQKLKAVCADYRL